MLALIREQSDLRLDSLLKCICPITQILYGNFSHWCLDFPVSITISIGPDQMPRNVTADLSVFCYPFMGHQALMVSYKCMLLLYCHFVIRIMSV